jgi:hypothetical protein
LFLAFFWIAVALVINYYWDVLERHAFVQVPRLLVAFVCFVLFSYNFIRWRLSRARQQAVEEDQPLPPLPRDETSEPDA